jgi:hypothetical protein
LISSPEAWIESTFKQVYQDLLFNVWPTYRKGHADNEFLKGVDDKLRKIGKQCLELTPAGCFEGIDPTGDARAFLSRDPTRNFNEELGQVMKLMNSQVAELTQILQGRWLEKRGPEDLHQLPWLTSESAASWNQTIRNELLGKLAGLTVILNAQADGRMVEGLRDKASIDEVAFFWQIALAPMALKVVY